MDSQDSAQYKDLLDLSTHSNDQSYSQNPNYYQRNFASQPKFVQDDYSIRNANRFSSGSFMPGQSSNAKGDLDQYLNFESTPRRLDQIQMPSNLNQKSDKELQSSFASQNNPKAPFQNQAFLPNNEKPMGPPGAGGVQDFFMNNLNNPNLLQQFNQFMQFMTSQSRSIPPFQNTGFNSDMQRNFAVPNMPFNMPQYNVQNTQSNQNLQQKPDSVDDGTALPSASELINGNFNSSRHPKERNLQSDFDSERKLNKSGESQFQTDEFENIEKNLDNYSVTTNIPVEKKKERDNKPIKVSQKEAIEKSEQHETNPFDDIKIKGVTHKRFEDLLEEQLRQNPDAIKKASGPKGAGPKKEFLKRGTGLNATNKPQKDKNAFNEEKENLGYNNESNFLSNDRKFRGDTERNTNNPLTVRHLNENNVLQDQNLFSDRQSITGKKNYGEKTDKKLDKFGAQGKKQDNLPVKAKKSEFNSQHKQHGQNKGFDEEADNSDSEGQNIQFDDPEEWRSPDKKEYNLEKYTQEAPVTFGTQEEEYRERSESPVYHFDDEFEADNAKTFNKRNYETKKKEEPIKEKGKFFWERGSEDIAPKQSEPQDRKKTKPIEQEKKTQPHMDSRLLVLEKEIIKFRAENERVESERKEWKETLEKLERQKEKWENLKDTERREIDEWKQEESKKIKKERKIVAESHQNMYKNVAGRKEREEIENLKKQLEELKEDMNAKDKRAKTNLEKLKKRLDDENQKTVELKQELKSYEEMRIKVNDPRNAKPSSQNYKSNVQPGRDKQDQGIKKELPKASQKKVREESESEVEEDIIHEEADEEEDSGDERNQRHHHGQKKRHGRGESELKYEDIIKDHRKSNDRGNLRDHAKPAEKASRTPSKVVEDKKSGQMRGGMEKREGNKSQNLRTNECDDEVEEYDDYPDSSRMPRFKERKSFSHDGYLFNTNAYFQKYLAKNRPNKVLKEVMFDDGKVQIQRIYEDGRREDVFFNGVRRLTFPDGYNIIYFINKDIRQTLPDSTVIYYYAEAQTSQTKLPNGECVYRFNKDNNDQIEFHYPDESKDIYFPDGSRKLVFPNQEEETSFPDGTITKVNAQKVKLTYYPDKTKEIFYPDGLKIRTYQDGRIKKFFPDGSVEIS